MSDELNVLELVTARLEGAGVLSGGGMNDISPDMEPRYRAMIMERSGEERLNVRCAKGMIRQAFWIGIRVHRPPRVWRIRATRRSGQIPARGKGRAGARGNPPAIRRQSGEFRLDDIEQACPGVGREWIRSLLTDLNAAGEATC